jgi:acyl carrier protein phosphodiesterase
MSYIASIEEATASRNVRFKPYHPISVNYLAHLLLAEPTDDSRLGAMIGDFMTGWGLESFSAGVREGIVRHRRIDELTDAHPVFQRSRERLRPSVGRFSGIVVDVVYDHFLAASWHRWHGAPLAEFAAGTYALLERRVDEAPPRLRRALPWIVGEDWLGAYAELSHLDRVFEGMARRIKRRNPLGDAMAGIAENYADLDSDFDEFFPALRDAVRSSDPVR